MKFFHLFVFDLAFLLLQNACWKNANYLFSINYLFIRLSGERKLYLNPVIIIFSHNIIIYIYHNRLSLVDVELYFRYLGVNKMQTIL